jgi:hypothetical protein
MFTLRILTHIKILWNVEPLLVNDREINSYTDAVVNEWPQQIHKRQQWKNWEAVSLLQSVRWLRDSTIEDLLGDMFSVQSVPRLYN